MIGPQTQQIDWSKENANVCVILIGRDPSYRSPESFKELISHYGSLFEFYTRNDVWAQSALEGAPK